MHIRLLMLRLRWAAYSIEFHQLHLKGQYDIAINKQPDGSFGLTADLWQGHVENEAGQGYGKLLQLYGVHKAIREARKKGHLVTRSQHQNGSIKLTLSVT